MFIEFIITRKHKQPKNPQIDKMWDSSTMGYHPGLYVVLRQATVSANPESNELSERSQTNTKTVWCLILFIVKRYSLLSRNWAVLIRT